MATIRTFRDLTVWQHAHTLVLAVYHASKQYPPDERFGLINQSRRAAASVPANIVEGFRRKSTKDSIRFYVIADASLEELKYHLLLACDLKYLDAGQYKTIMNQAESVGKLLTRWIQSQRSFL